VASSQTSHHSSRSNILGRNKAFGSSLQVNASLLIPPSPLSASTLIFICASISAR
jgi:hypothetical protein